MTVNRRAYDFVVEPVAWDWGTGAPASQPGTFSTWEEITTTIDRVPHGAKAALALTMVAGA